MKLTVLNSFLSALNSIDRQNAELQVGELSSEANVLGKIWPELHNAPGENVLALTSQLQTNLEAFSDEMKERFKQKYFEDLGEAPSTLQTVIEMIDRSADEVIELTEKQGLLIREIWAKAKQCNESTNQTAQAELAQFIISQVVTFNELNIKIVMTQEFQDATVRKLKVVIDLLKQFNLTVAELKETLCGIVSQSASSVEDSTLTQQAKAPAIVDQSEIDELLKSFGM